MGSGDEVAENKGGETAGGEAERGKAARRDEAEKARTFWKEATPAGLKSDLRKQWVMGRLGRCEDG